RPHRHATGACLFLGKSDRGDLRLGEDDLRDGAMISGRGEGCPRNWAPVLQSTRGARRDRVAAHARLILPHVREQGTRVDVARGIEPAARHRGNPHAVVDLQPGSWLQAYGLEPEVVGSWLAPGGNEHLVGDDRPSALKEEPHRPIAIPFHAARGGAREHGHRASLESFSDGVARERLISRDQPRTPLNDGEFFAPELRPGSRHLTADDPAAEDREPPGCLLGTGGFTTRPCVGFRQAWDRGDRRTAAGADRDGMAGHELGARPILVSHRDTALASEATMAADEVDSVLLEPCG